MAADLLDLLTVEVLVPPADTLAFVLDETRLDVGALGERAEALAWQPIMSKARSITTRRGGSADRISNTIEVGVLTVELVDPPQMRIRPSTPVRVRTPAGTPIFTGQVTDVRSQHLRRLGAKVTTNQITTLTAVDAVQELANTMRYGAVVGGDEAYEAFEDRIIRLMRSTSVPYNIAPNELIDVYSEFWNQPYPGPSTGPTPEAATAVWDITGPATFSISTGEGQYSAHIQPEWNAHITAGECYMATVLHGFIPGATYEITVAFAQGTGGLWLNDVYPAVGVLGHGWTPAPDLEAPEAVHSFAATSTSHTVILTYGTTFTVPPEDPSYIRPWISPSSMRIVQQERRLPLGQNWLCQDVVYESTLANHLDLAVATVRGRWWVDASGTLQAAREEGTIASDLTLTDNTAGRSDAVSYVAVDTTFDTARVVNDARLENHGRTYDLEMGSWVADDRTITATDPTSIATNGRRAGDVDTCVYDPPDPQSIHYGAGAQLATAYVQAFRDADERISRVRLHTTNRSADPEQIAALDVYAAVTAEHEALTIPSRIIAIEHEITPEDWHTTIDLIERTA